MSIQKVSIRQVKAARSLLAWSQEQLAERSSVSIPTIKRLEAEDGELGGRTETTEKILSTLENAGIIFVKENGEGPGVRMKKERSGVKDHPEPKGPASDLVKQMDAAIDTDRKKPKRSR